MPQVHRICPCDKRAAAVWKVIAASAMAGHAGAAAVATIRPATTRTVKSPALPNVAVREVVVGAGEQANRAIGTSQRYNASIRPPFNASMP